MVNTEYNIGDEVWFFDTSDRKIGHGNVYRIHVEHCEQAHSEYYDIDGVYDTGVASGIRHFNIPPYDIRKTKEELDKIDFWH